MCELFQAVACYHVQGHQSSTSKLSSDIFPICRKLTVRIFWVDLPVLSTHYRLIIYQNEWPQEFMAIDVGDGCWRRNVLVTI